MKEQGRRGFLGILFGLIGVTAGGGITYVAMNKRAGQDVPIMSTRSEDTNQDGRHQGQEKTRTAGDTRIGITFEQYEADLERREREITERLQQALAEEHWILEAEQAELARRLADTESGYRAAIAKLRERIDRLETIRGQVPDAPLDQARDALARGDRSAADRHFAQFGGQSTPAVAEAAYQRSRIARDEIRYPAAYAHAQRAVRLVPENGRYLTGVGELAGILGDHTTARDYHEQALVSNLETLGEDHPDVAKNRNHLGLAWQKLGEHCKAIGYFEQALAGDLRTYGEDHPDVARNRNHLGLAWQKLGEPRKAIGYLEQALAGDLMTYGEDHPRVATDRNNLGEVWRALGEHRKAIGYLEQALASALETYGEHHSQVAIYRNNLGLAWQRLGEHQKAIDYLEQALAGDLELYGEGHPTVARDRNNLGTAWKKLGEYQKAIGYYEQALAVFEHELGSTHPSTRTVRENLAAARAGPGETAAAGRKQNP